MIVFRLMTHCYVVSDTCPSGSHTVTEAGVYRLGTYSVPGINRNAVAEVDVLGSFLIHTWRKNWICRDYELVASVD